MGSYFWVFVYCGAAKVLPALYGGKQLFQLSRQNDVQYIDRREKNENVLALAKSTKREPRPIQRKTNARHLTSPLSLDAFTLWTRYIDLVASVRCPSIIVSRNDFRSVLDNNAHEQRGRHKNIAHPVLASTSYVNITYAIVLFVFFK